MKALKRKKVFYYSGRPKKKRKPDNSDIPGLIEEMSQEQKDEIVRIWIEEQREQDSKK